MLIRNGERLSTWRHLRRKQPKRYDRPLPGGRVEVDVRKVGPDMCQYTAIDDRTRFQVVGVCRRRTASSSIHYLERVGDEMPFPIQRIQTGRGQEIFADAIQDRLRD
ncbi:MAG: hypothetical protein AAFX81_17760 [Pseudomonadota bacterium]